MTGTGKKIIVVVKSCSDETSSTISSLSSDSIERQAKHRMRKKKKEQHASSSNAAASSNDDYEMTFYKDEEQSEVPVNVPPMIAFQKIKLLELKRRCNGIYRRHQGRRRSRMINLEKNQEYMNISEQQQQQHGMIDEEYFV